jgi:hypothetical protein
VTRRRVVASGVAIVIAYVGALAITVAVRDARVRPLYDGFAPPSSYRWVDPPAFFAAGNEKPGPVTSTVALGPSGSQAAGIATPDGQFVIDLAGGAIAPHGSDRRVDVAVTPIDPKHLPTVPLHLRANGNAYRVAMTYEPSNTPVAALARPGTLLVELPEVGTQLFRSDDSRHWTTVSSRAVSSTQLSLSAAFSAPAVYVGATNLPELAGSTGSAGNHSLALGIGVGVLALLLVVVGAFVARRVRRRPSPAP